MDWEEFTVKYGHISKEFNEQEHDERERTSRFMTYEAIRELIRSKNNLHQAIKNIDKRIKELLPNLQKQNTSV